MEFWFRPAGRNARIVILAVFSILILTAAGHHEPWYDEAQAWLLVRDTSLWDMLSHFLRYEGHPSLWYLVIWIPVHAHLPYEWFNLVPALIAIAGVWVFLRYSPFPLGIQLLFPFGFFMLFQYGVIARNYCLLPLVLYAIAAVYHRRFQMTLRYTGLLILLSHVSLHGTAIALGLFCLGLIEMLFQFHQLDTTERKERLIGVILFLLSCGLLVLQLYLPDDGVVSGGKPVKNPLLFLSDGLTGNVILTIVFVGVTFLWLDMRHRLLLLLVPLSALLILFSFVYKEWHQGIPWLLWVFVLWISLEDSPDTPVNTGIPPAIRSWVRSGLLAVFALVLVVHVYWGLTAVYNDGMHPYSATRELAAYLKDHHLPRDRIFMAGLTTVGVLPYFKENIFYNFNDGRTPCFWQWSQKNPLIFDVTRQNNTGRYLSMIRQTRPDVVVVDGKYKRNLPLLAALKQDPGYRFVRMFTGNLYWKDSILETEIYVLFIRKAMESR